MSSDRIIFSFIVGWIVLVALLIALDWLGNPNRGHFRPRGERQPLDRAARKAERARRRLDEDASVRAALRDAYGASSLRLNWTSDQETEVRRIDDSLVVEEREGAVDVVSREVDGLHSDDEGIDLDADTDMTEPESDGPETDEPVEPEQDGPDEPEPRAVGWTVGDDPLALTAKGNEPASGTVRGRVWKNHAISGGWGEDNRALLAAGKAPRRRNPITGLDEKAVVDAKSGRASWGREPVDPFEADG
ncbi:MAG: hypothetical protein RIB98_03325 [Acidimicrobiales bacterium]